MAPKRTPLGIKILAVLGAIGGIFGVLGGLGLLGTPLFLLGLFVLVLAVGQVAVAVGLWNLQSWAYTWTLILYGLSMLLDVVELLLGDPSALIGLLISLLIVAYVTSKSHLFE